MPADYWWQAKAGWRFKCEFCPEKVKEKQPAQYKKIQEAMGDIPESEWKHHTPCCGSWFIPWAHGASKVLEMKVADTHHAIRAERMPDELDDEIKKVQMAFHEACGRTTAEQIRKAIPNSLPNCNLLDPAECKVPGIARFNIKRWKDEGCPTILVAGWAALCKVIAKNSTIDMSDLITLCDDIAIKNEQDPALKTAMEMARGIKPTRPVSTSSVEC